MTTAIRDSYQFNATVQSKGKQRNSDGWTLTLDWKLPGSKFDLVLYGKEWEEVGLVNVGDRASFDIARGGLKADKDGKYASDYFWNLAGIGDPQPESKAAPAKPAGAASKKPAAPGAGDKYVAEAETAWENPPPEYARNQAQDSIQQRIAWNSAINNATNLLPYLPLPAGGDWHPLLLQEAAWYYQVITAGPPASVPLGSLECDQGKAHQGKAAKPLQNPVEAPEAPAPTQSPAGPNTASFEALSAFNGAWKAALTRNQWKTEEEALAAAQGYIARNYQGRKLRQLQDAEVAEVTAAVRMGKL